MNPSLCPPSLPAYGRADHQAGPLPRNAEWPRKVRAFAPASVGNFAAGFDFLGAALAPEDGLLLGNIVEAERTERDAFEVSGPYADRVPRGDGNLVLEAARRFRGALEARGLVSFPVRLHLEARLAPGGGLGSSASSIVATLQALQALHGHPLGPGEILRLAGESEGSTSGGVHLDNVTPAYLGGLRLAGAPLPGRAALPWPEDLRVVILHPGLELPTRESRAALPSSLSLEASVDFSRNAAAFVQALHTGDREGLARTLHDPVAEAHRAPLVPGFLEAKAAALASGALGCSLSGSGPSLFAVAQRGDAAEVRKALLRAFPAPDRQARAWVCGLDARGARLLSSWAPKGSACA